MRRVIQATAVLTLLASAAALAGDGSTPAPATATASETAPAPAPAPPASTTYALSTTGSSLFVVVRNDPEAFLARFGHDHALVATQVQGSVTWPTTPGAGDCRVDITVPVKSLVVDPPGYREKAGLDPDGTISEDRKPTLLKNAWSDDQLDAAHHPNVVFHSDGCPGGTGKVKVDGSLEIRGVKRPVTVTMDVKADGATFSASGRLDLTHEQFGFEPYQFSPTGPRNQQGLQLHVQVKGAKG